MKRIGGRRLASMALLEKEIAQGEMAKSRAEAIPVPGKSRLESRYIRYTASVPARADGRRMEKSFKSKMATAGMVR